MGQFFVSHRLELLDQVGEFYHDAHGGYLYLGVTKGMTPPTAYGALHGPTVQTIFSVQGTQAHPVKGFRVSGVVFRHDPFDSTCSAYLYCVFIIVVLVGLNVVGYKVPFGGILTNALV